MHSGKLVGQGTQTSDQQPLLRTLRSFQKQKKLQELAKAGAESAEPFLSIRDPYIFEFLGLKPKEVMSESHLEDQLNEIRQKQLLDLAYDSPFRIGLCVFITLPSAPGGPWGGVAGVQKLIGVRALRKLEQEESSRVFKLAAKFINSKGAVIAFQKNAWNNLRAENDSEYSNHYHFF